MRSSPVSDVSKATEQPADACRDQDGRQRPLPEELLAGARDAVDFVSPLLTVFRGSLAHLPELLLGSVPYGPAHFLKVFVTSFACLPSRLLVVDMCFPFIRDEMPSYDERSVCEFCPGASSLPDAVYLLVLFLGFVLVRPAGCGRLPVAGRPPALRLAAAVAGPAVRPAVAAAAAAAGRAAAGSPCVAAAAPGLESLSAWARP